MSDNHWYKSKFYYRLSDSVDDVNLAHGAKETAVSCASLVGKTIFNVGLFAGKMGVEIVKKMPEAIEKASKK